jgi:hypothetical protein
MTNTNEETKTIREIPICKIRTDRTQSRAGLNPDTVREYAETMKEYLDDADSQRRFPPLIVYLEENGEEKIYWLADGFHRLAAADEIGCNFVWCEIRQGTYRDALRESLRSNIAHGLRRTNEDKRYAVGLVLADADWRGLSDRAIADMCGVSPPFVATVRASGVNRLHLEPTTRTGLDGKSYPAPQPQTVAEPIEVDDDEPANVQTAELDDLADDADDFDEGDHQDELGRLTPRATPSAANANGPKSGTEIVPAKLQKEAIQIVGSLAIKLHALGIARDVESEWEAIKRRVHTADGPAREMKDGEWVPITGNAEWRDGDWHEVEDEDDKGWGAPEDVLTPMEEKAA